MLMILKKILTTIEQLGNLKDNIVDTKILSKKKGILEHSFINPIIHSGEYTESMLYDVTSLTFDLAFIKTKRETSKDN